LHAGVVYLVGWFLKPRDGTTAAGRPIFLLALRDLRNDGLVPSAATFPELAVR